MESVLHITDGEFQKEVIESEIPVLVDFWAPWCGPCRMLGPVLEKIGEKFAGKLKVVKINTDENSVKAKDLNVSGIPAMFVFKGGKQVDNTVGYVPETTLEALVNKYI